MRRHLSGSDLTLRREGVGSEADQIPAQSTQSTMLNSFLEGKKNNLCIYASSHIYTSAEYLYVPQTLSIYCFVRKNCTKSLKTGTFCQQEFQARQLSWLEHRIHTSGVGSSTLPLVNRILWMPKTYTHNGRLECETLCLRLHSVRYKSPLWKTTSKMTRSELKHLSNFQEKKSTEIPLVLAKESGPGKANLHMKNMLEYIDQRR